MAFLAIINLMMVVALSPLVFELMREYKAQKDRGEPPILYTKNITYLLPEDNEWGMRIIVKIVRTSISKLDLNFKVYKNCS